MWIWDGGEYIAANSEMSTYRFEPAASPSPSSCPDDAAPAVQVAYLLRDLLLLGFVISLFVVLG